MSIKNEQTLQVNHHPDSDCELFAEETYERPTEVDVVSNFHTRLYQDRCHDITIYCLREVLVIRVCFQQQQGVMAMHNAIYLTHSKTIIVDSPTLIYFNNLKHPERYTFQYDTFE